MTSRRYLCLALAAALASGCGSAPKHPTAVRRQLPKVQKNAKREFDRGVRELRLSRGDSPKDLSRARARAKKHFEDALAIDPSLWEAWHDLGVVSLAEGDSQGAATALRRAIQIQPGSVFTALALADVLTRLGQYDAARTELQRALSALPKKAAEEDSGELDKADKPDDAAKDKDKGKDAAKDKDEEAAGALDKGLPSEAAVRLKLAALLRQTKKTDAAIAEVRTVLRLEPSGPVAGKAFVELGLIYYAGQKLDLAALALRKAAALAPKDPVVWNTLGLVALALGKDQEAFGHFDHASSLDPSFGVARFNKGSVYLDAGDYGHAIPELEAATTADPRDAAALIALGVALRGKKRYDEARGAYERALTVDPRNADALYNLGVLEMDFLESPAKARDPLERFLRVAPSSHPKRADAESRMKEIAPPPAPSAGGAPGPTAPKTPQKAPPPGKPPAKGKK